MKLKKKEFRKCRKCFIQNARGVQINGDENEQLLRRNSKHNELTSCDSSKSYCKKLHFLTCGMQILEIKLFKNMCVQFYRLFFDFFPPLLQCVQNVNIINTVLFCSAEIGLTVQSNIRKCQDDRAVCPWGPCHGAVELSILSLYVLLLKQTHRFSHTFRSLIHAAG